jgi:hypothetical protein
MFCLKPKQRKVDCSYSRKSPARRNRRRRRQQQPLKHGNHIPQALQAPATMSVSPYIFDSPDADVILRAPHQLGSDEFEDYYVHKIILSIASSVFQDILSIPQPPRRSSEDTTLDVIGVTEPAKVLETFLQLIYPVDPPVIEDLRLMDDLFRLADKYAAKGVNEKLKKRLISPSFLKGDPIGVFAIACRNNLEEERLAVSHTFSIDIINEISEENIQTMTAKTYHVLLAKHAFRREQLLSTVDQAVLQMRPAASWISPCACVEKLKKEIRLEISRRPFLNKEILEMCFSSMKALGLKCGASGTGSCIYAPGPGARFLAEIAGILQAMPCS